MVAWWIVAGIVVVLFVLVLWFMGAYNRIIRQENRIDNAWAQIDVQLRRRSDLIPNLVNTVKGYKDFEQQTLMKVTDARTKLASAVEAGDRQGAMEANGVLDQMLPRIFAVAEAYPDLKASQNFLQLQDELSHTENQVAFARQAYNDAVLAFNNSVESMPTNIVAGIMGRQTHDMLEVPEASREVPEVEF